MLLADACHRTHDGDCGAGAITFAPNGGGGVVFNASLLVNGAFGHDCGGVPIFLAGIISAAVEPGKLWKLLRGKVQSDFRGAPISPTHATPNATSFQCGTTPGCLFELVSDPFETTDVAAAHPDIAAALAARVAVYDAGVFRPNRGPSDSRCCEYVRNVWKGFLGPFVDVP